jgi:hypothetical protein
MYRDEAYAIGEDVNRFKKKQALDSGKRKEIPDSMEK